MHKNCSDKKRKGGWTLEYAAVDTGYEKSNI